MYCFSQPIENIYSFIYVLWFVGYIFIRLTQMICDSVLVVSVSATCINRNGYRCK